MIRRQLQLQPLEKRELLAFAAFQNPIDRYDVNLDGQRTPADLRVVFSAVLDEGQVDLSSSAGIQATGGQMMDVNGDDYVTAADLRGMAGVLIGEGEPDPATQLVQDVAGEGEPVELPPGQTIFDFAQTQIQRLVSNGQILNREFVDSVGDVFQDDRDLLSMLREQMLQQTTATREQIIEDAKAGNTAGLQDSVKVLRETNQKTGQIAKQIAEENVDLVHALQDLQQHGTMEVIQKPAGDIRDEIVDLSKPFEEKMEGIAEAADESDAALEDSLDQFETIHEQRIQQNNAIAQQIADLGSIGGVSIGTFFGAASVMSDAGGVCNPVNLTPSFESSLRMTSEDQFRGDLSVTGIATLDAANAPNCDVVALDVVGTGSVNGRVTDPATGAFEANLQYSFPLPQGGMANVSLVYQGTATIEDELPVGLDGILLNNGQQVGTLTMMKR